MSTSHIDISTKCVTSPSHDMFIIFNIEFWVASDCIKKKKLCRVRMALVTIYAEFVAIFEA